MTGITALYVRVSTDDQELDNQKNLVADYATDSLDVDLDDVEFYQDKATGTNTDREGWQELMADVRAGEVDRIVARSGSRISRSMGDLVNTIDVLVDDHEVGIHFVKDGLELDPDTDDPMTRAMVHIVGVFSDLQARMIQENTKDAVNAAMAAGKHVGRPPFGFETTDDGYLTPKPDEYALAREAIDKVDKGESKRSTARATGIDRKTLDRVLDRREMYEGDPETDE